MMFSSPKQKIAGAQSNNFNKARQVHALRQSKHNTQQKHDNDFPHQQLRPGANKSRVASNQREEMSPECHEMVLQD